MTTTDPQQRTAIDDPLTNAHVLVADDEPDILQAVKVLFMRAGVPGEQITVCRSAEEALVSLTDKAADVVISDQRMARMTGIDFLHEVKRVHPTAVRMMMTGYNEESIAIEAINRARVDAFVLKPWRSAEFIDLVRDALTQRIQKEGEDRAPALDLVSRIRCGVDSQVRRPLA